MAEYIERDAARPDAFCIGVSCQDCPFLINPVYGGCKIEDFIMAIPAADVVERKTGNEDLISRQTAIDALNEHRSIFCDNTPETFRCLPYDEKCRVDEIDNAVATLINLPSAQSERKTGKWITVKHPLYECSVCGAVYQDVGYGFNFCPNCGTDMRGDDDV